MSAIARALPRGNAWSEAMAFAVQMLIAVSVELGDDLGRGLLSQHGTLQGIQNAHRIVSFEAAHGFWVEPAWQSFFEKTHHLLVFTLTWPEVVRFMNGVYILGHVFVTIGVALWVYMYRRPAFGILRNTLILSNAIALVVYESFPVAPPRMTPNLTFNHHPFHFVDTINGIISAGRSVIGVQASGYNEFSAMPSVHMIWAILAGLSIVILARPLWVKVLGALYPVLMLVSVVVTANHYLLDAVGGVVVLTVAAIIAFSFDRWRARHTVRRQLGPVLG